MPGVIVKDGEPLESAVRRFKRIIERAKIPQRLRNREHHVTKSAERKIAKAAAKKRLLKKLSRERELFGGGIVRNNKEHRGRGDQ